PRPASLMAQNSSSKIRACSCGDPVNLATGNLAETIGDLSVPGRGVSLNFNHSYNSLMAAVNGALGYGWTSSYAMSLALGAGSPPVTATVIQENGAQVDYSVSGTAYSAAPWVLASLVHNADGSWTFTRQATGIFTFNAAGQLIAEQDLNGYKTTLAYNGTGQLTTVTDPGGRTLTIGWSGTHIVGVTDTASPPRSVTFGYNDGNGNLTDVVDADGGHTVYTYDAGHNLVTMRAPRYYQDTTTTPPPVTTSVYNGAHQVISQTDPAANTTRFDYTPKVGRTSNGLAPRAILDRGPDMRSSRRLLPFIPRWYSVSGAFFLRLDLWPFSSPPWLQWPCLLRVQGARCQHRDTLRA
ncbi:MAG TPA: DUF6531 domain-containing protein, partial [Actinomycetota bacterium]